jgi:hypothetical protein
VIGVLHGAFLEFTGRPVGRALAQGDISKHEGIWVVG